MSESNTEFNPVPVEYAAGPWVLLHVMNGDDYVIDIVHTAAEVGEFINEQRAHGVDFDIDTVQNRCVECGEETALNRPHAPECPIETGEPNMDVSSVVGYLDTQIKAYRAGGELAPDAVEEIITGLERLLDRFDPRHVDGCTTAVTIDQVDIHVKTVGNTTTVMVGAEEAPDDRTVLVEDWSGMGWEQVIKGKPVDRPDPNEPAF
ncbi:hypothetical protein AB0F93_00410 [Micromonospora tulbaghiae]|uniref:hypothetical protein n=1 Tax=Micromonospora tulbaghiae TaxID=479978 RepID=UPI003325CFF5